MIPRACVYKNDTERHIARGDGYLAMPRITTDATAGSRTFTAEGIAGGVLQFTGAAGAVNYTSPTATLLNAVFSDLEIGESFVFKISNTAAQTATIVGGTGVTVSGNSTVNAGMRECVLVRTAASTFNIICM